MRGSLMPDPAPIGRRALMTGIAAGELPGGMLATGEGDGDGEDVTVLVRGNFSALRSG